MNVHPLFLEFGRAYAKAARSGVADAPLGSGNPWQEKHRAERAWQAAGYPVEIETETEADANQRGTP